MIAIQSVNRERARNILLSNLPRLFIRLCGRALCLETGIAMPVARSRVLLAWDILRQVGELLVRTCGSDYALLNIVIFELPLLVAHVKMSNCNIIDATVSSSTIATMHLKLH
jgi:hypothetical protein